MTVAHAGRAPATFEIKSANLPLVSLLLKSADLAALAEELNARFGDIPDFFDHDPLVIDLSKLQGADALDFRELLHLLRGYRVLPVAVRGGDEKLMAAALEAGLAAANELRVIKSEVISEAAHAPTPTPTCTPESKLSGDPAALPQEVREPEEAPRHAMIIDKPLRSGQQVYARGRDLIVMCMVNPGAEVIADGNIHVYAPLRGKAIAGARGNTEARVLSLCLEPELISIAGVYRTSEVPLPAELRGKPAQVRLVGGAEGKLVMDPLK